MAHPAGQDPTGRDFFEAVYAADDDPWAFASDPYELARYRHIVSLLGGRRYRSAFEPGCSIGVLTAMLAPHCDRLLATDLSARAVERARERCAGLAHVDIAQGRFPDVLPPSPVDLVVLSEIGYYFDPPVFADAVEQVVHVASPGALVVAAHWTGASPDHVTTGDEVHRTLGASPCLERLDEERRPGYLIARFRVRPMPTVGPGAAGA